MANLENNTFFKLLSNLKHKKRLILNKHAIFDTHIIAVPTIPTLNVIHICYNQIDIFLDSL